MMAFLARTLRAAPLFLLAVLLGVSLPRAAGAQVALLNGFGGPAGYGPGNLPPNDDGSTPVIDLTPAFPSGLTFFGSTYRSFYVNNNGNITFNGPVFNYTPISFPIAMQPMIAPFWGDV